MVLPAQQLPVFSRAKPKLLVVENLRTFALIVSAHPSAHAISPATSCMSARVK